MNLVTLLPRILLALRAAVRDRPEDATKLIKAREGMIDPSIVFREAV